MTDRDYMALAIETTRRGIREGQSPFGAVIVRGKEIVADTHNTVWRTTDPTAHGEVNAIRQAALNLKTIDLSGTVLYSTCEPCPMCLTAIHWAKIDRLVFGASIADAKNTGFEELTISAAEMIRLGGGSLKVEGGLMQAECVDLFRYFLDNGGKVY